MYSWSFCSCIIALSLVFFSLLRRKKRALLPPGPFCWPLVGALLSVGKGGHRSFAKLAKQYGPIMYLEMGSRPHLIISSASLAKVVLKDHDAEFANRPQFSTLFRHLSHNFTDLIFAPYGDGWKALRRVCGMELFTTSKVNFFSGIRKRELAAFASAIGKSASNRQSINMSLFLHELFRNLMSSVLFGKKLYSVDEPVTPEAQQYREKWQVLIAEVQKVMIGDFIPAVESLLNSTVEEHRKQFQADNPRDFVDVMLAFCALKNQDIIAILQDMLLAGTGTSKGTLEWAFTELLRNPRVLSKAQEELDAVVGKDREIDEADVKCLPYLHAIVKETLRLHPVAPMGLPHLNKAAVDLCGYRIPPNSTVLINIWAIGRDPATWTDPYTFLPERFLNTDCNMLGQHFEFIPFSSGRRRCVGMPLAIPHVTFTLAYLLHKFNWSADELPTLEECTGVACIPAKPLILSPSPRH